MFDEREALKTRLKQLDKSEVRIMEELIKEREAIYVRLRELDEQNLMATNASSLIAATATNTVTKAQNTSGKTKRLPRQIVGQQFDIAIAILRYHTAAISGLDLKKEIELRSGFPISNFTNFMDRLIKKEPAITRPFRGSYYLEREEEAGSTEQQAE